MTLGVNNAMTSSVQKVVTHNTDYAHPQYQLRTNYADQLRRQPVPTTPISHCGDYLLP
ncbi:hypothetical protein HMPREF0293_2206 [Corynebacterium glucuronolyticum ATCC 51866]|uniref:Uncharacterized protein n=1 Tax=Corynebacterium glucuronolyticum ATCC 51866 TaxID=548478 RepID=A0ABM9XMC8_9CORY|nr:hypothetical protein HMPREF0293_2206 [Corynebacterium glucuronolyticum ATCC 51866]